MCRKLWPPGSISVTQVVRRTAASCKAYMRPLPMRTIRRVRPPLRVTTALLAKMILARGLEKRTNTRPVMVAVSSMPTNISTVETTWLYKVTGAILP